MKQRKEVHIVSHTHWDREWYLTQEQYRVRLVDLVDNLVDLLAADPGFEHFHLDGQTIVLDDYADVRASRVDDLRRLVRGGRVLVGPWYEQNDLFLTSGESTVRNLMEGIRTARDLGGEMRVGYLPDHFGLIGQMPQIFRLVGIDNCIFGRGFDARKHETARFRWNAPDGSDVLAIHMTFWYNNAQRFPTGVDALRSVFERIMDREELIAPGGPYLLMNGVDHLEAQENLTAILARLREAYGDDYEILHSTMPDYVNAYRRSAPTPSLEMIGELREGHSYSILDGTLSARVYVKQANDACGDLIEKWLEPVSVWCAALGLSPVDRDYMRFIWKLFMANHPHDSICGCSTDAVHEHMMDRYERLTEIVEELLRRKFALLARQVDSADYDPGDLKLLVANGSALALGAGPDAVCRTVAASVYFLADDEVRDFDLIDPAGESVRYRVVREEESRILALSPINLPGVLRVRRFDVEFVPTADAYGYACYRVVRGANGARVAEPSVGEPAAGDPVLENEFLRVTVHPNGRFDLESLETGRVISDLGRFHDVADAGDLYVSIPDGDERVWDGEVDLEPARDYGLHQECSYRFSWPMPADLAEARRARSAAESRSAAENRSGAENRCEIAVTLRLDRGARALDVRVEIDNEANDHRLRFVIPTAGADSVLAGGQFDVVRRELDAGREWERSANGQPFWKWVAPTSGDSGLALFAAGLHEYEVIAEDRLGITLVRGVATINLRDATPLETDRQVLGQCRGRHGFRLALRPFDDVDAVRLTHEAELFTMGVRTTQAPVDDDRWFQGRTWVQGSAAEGAFQRPDPNAGRPTLPRSGRLLEVDGEAVVSAIKWNETRDEVVVRFVSLAESESETTIGFCVPAEAAECTNLLEEPLSGAEVRPDGRVRVVTRPRQIVTVSVRLRRPS